MAFYTFEPIYQERVWGGRNLESKLGRTLPDDGVYGESWEIVDRPEAMSTTSDGLTLRELLERDGETIMGSGWDPARPFPILVKWLDCQEKLSLQVHPPADVAGELGGEPKTENWYIAEAESHATVMAGLRQGVTREQFEEGLKQNGLEPLVHTIPVKAGESIFIPSGRLHAIGGGNLILEIQQNSDTTYRVYDWGRVGLDGKPRQLHIEESMRSTDFEDFEPNMVSSDGHRQTLANCSEFTLERCSLQEGEEIHFDSGQPRILSLIRGNLLDLADQKVLKHSQSAILPASQPSDFQSVGDCELLITSNFNP